MGDGANTLFWDDRWINGRSMAHIAPCLLAAIPKRRRRRSVAAAILGRAWTSDIRGALTVQVIIEYLRVWELLENVQLRQGGGG